MAARKKAKRAAASQHVESEGERVARLQQSDAAGSERDSEIESEDQRVERLRRENSAAQ